MIEVDVFWSFAFGASFAAAAGPLILQQGDKSGNKAPWVWPLNLLDTRILTSPYFAYNLIFLSVLFAPSGIYLLWRFPGWESMFVLGAKDTIHAILPTVFSATNSLLGIIGFYLAARAITNKNELFAHSLWTLAYTCFSAILGMGYARFLYAGTHDDWAAGKAFPLTDFFTCEVFYTLLVMGVFILPAYYAPIISWFSASCAAGVNKSRVIAHILRSYLIWTVLIAVGFVATVQLGGPELRAYLSHGPVLHYAPLVGFLVAQTLLVVLTVWPFAVVAGSSKKTK